MIAFIFLLIGCNNLSNDETNMRKFVASKFPSHNISEIKMDSSLKSSWIIKFNSDSSRILIQNKDTLINNQIIPRKSIQIANEVIVKLRSEFKLIDFRNIIDEKKFYNNEISIIDSIPKTKIFRLRIANSRVVNHHEVIKELKSLNLFDIVEPNYIVTQETNQYLVNYSPKQWYLYNSGTTVLNSKIDADIDGIEVLSRCDPKKLKEVIVAVIDCGIDINHPSLKDNIWINKQEIEGNNIDDDGNGYVDDVFGWNFQSNNNSVYDYNGHGTHIAGIICSKENRHGCPVGISANSKLLVAKYTNGSIGSTFNITKAINYCIEKKVDIINMSFGGYDKSDILYDAVKSAYYTNKIVLVAAAGNDAIDIYEIPYYPASFVFVNTVASTNCFDELSSFSNYQGYNSSWNYAVIDIAAPGTDIYSTIPGGGFKLMSGTSMACPQVTATFALLKGIYWDESPNELRLRILNSADIVSSLHNKVPQSRRLNIYRAIYQPKVTADFCNELVSGQPRCNRYPYANYGDEGIDGDSYETAYEICTIEQLLNIRKVDMNKHFRLVKNLVWHGNLSSETNMIGFNSNIPFNGIIWGDGYTIFGFSLKSEKEIGLIKHIGKQGRVINLKMEGVYLQGKGNVGSIAAICEGGINNVQVTGVVKGNRNVGGLVGDLKGGWVYNGYYEGQLLANSFVGGVSGKCSRGAKIKRCHTRVDLIGDISGGISGELSGDCEINEAYSFVKIKSNFKTGGLVGSLQCMSSIKNSYTEGRVYSSNTGGGLVGEISNASVDNSYSLCHVVGDKDLGGLIGVKNDDIIYNIGGDYQKWKYKCTNSQIPPIPTSITNSYFLRDNNKLGAGGVPKSLIELKDKNTFNNWFSTFNWTIPKGFTPASPALPRTNISLY